MTRNGHAIKKKRHVWEGFRELRDREFIRANSLLTNQVGSVERALGVNVFGHKCW